MKLLRSQSICLALIAIFALASQGQAPQRIEIVASRYTFEPNTITLKKSVPVVLVLRTSDVAHGLQIKELGLNVQIPKGKTVEAPLTPDKAGTFRGKCSRFCGAGHGRMNMTVTVTE